MYYPRFSFVPKTGIELPKTRVSFLQCKRLTGFTLILETGAWYQKQVWKWKKTGAILTVNLQWTSRPPKLSVSNFYDLPKWFAFPCDASFPDFPRLSAIGFSAAENVSKKIASRTFCVIYMWKRCRKMCFVGTIALKRKIFPSWILPTWTTVKAWIFHLVRLG